MTNFNENENNMDDAIMGDSTYDESAAYTSDSDNSFIVDDTDGVAPTYTTDSPTPNTMPPKKSKEVNLLIPLFVVLAIVLAGGITVFAFKDKLTNTIKEKTSSPVDYYHSVEKDNFKDSLDTYMDTYKKSYDVLTSDSLGTNSSVRVDLADDVTSLITTMYPQLAGLKSAEIGFDGGFASDTFSFNLNTKINDTDIISANMFLDSANSKFYAQVPEISDDYLDLSPAIAGDEFAEVSKMMSSFDTMLSSIYPEPDTMKKWAETYFNLIVDSTKNVTKESSSVSANGIEQKATKLTVNMSGTEMYDMLYKLLDTMEKDESLSKYFTDYASVLEFMGGVGSYTSLTAEDFTKALGEAKTSLETSKDEFASYTKLFTMTVYVDGDGNIIGREIILSNEGEGATDDITTYAIISKKAVSGKEMGYELAIKENEETYFTIVGKGSADLSKFEGEYVATIPSEEMTITAKVENGNIANYLSGDIKCDVTITTDYDTLKDYSLKLSLDSKLMETKMSLEVGGKEMNFGKITINALASKEVTSRAPADSATKIDLNDSTALMGYISNFNPETFINEKAAAAGLSITYSDIMSLFSSGSDDFESDDSYDDYDFDYDSKPYDVYEFDMNDSESYEFDMNDSEAHGYDNDETYEFDMDDSEAHDYDIDEAYKFDF